jgi:hypothetical protein
MEAALIVVLPVEDFKMQMQPCGDSECWHCAHLIHWQPVTTRDQVWVLPGSRKLDPYLYPVYPHPQPMRVETTHDNHYMLAAGIIIQVNPSTTILGTCQAMVHVILHL